MPNIYFNFFYRASSILYFFEYCSFICSFTQRKILHYFTWDFILRSPYHHSFGLKKQVVLRASGWWILHRQAGEKISRLQIFKRDETGTQRLPESRTPEFHRTRSSRKSPVHHVWNWKSGATGPQNNPSESTPIWYFLLFFSTLF